MKQLAFAWWNTCLSPVRGRKPATDEDKEIALKVILQLIYEYQVDCLALGEVTPEDIIEIQRAGNFDSFGLHEPEKHGRQQFDTGIFYRRGSFEKINVEDIISRRGPKSLKVATRIELYIHTTGHKLHLFVSHWPSRLWCAENGADRHLLGIRLRDSIDLLGQDGENPIYAVILGDFNDDPFDDSLSKQLFATRDRRLVQKRPYLFYNPFWRHLGESMPFPVKSATESHCGSYYYQSGNETKAYTFDQIMFSGAFLGNGDWHLNEKHTQILYLVPLRSIVYNSNHRFDHFPVISVIEREAPDD